MTREEIDKISFTFRSHFAMSGRHSTTYQATNVPFTLLMCVSAPAYDYDTNERGPGKTTKHYLLEGKLLKSKKSLYKELEKYDTSRIMSDGSQVVAEEE